MELMNKIFFWYEELQSHLGNTKVNKMNVTLPKNTLKKLEAELEEEFKKGIFIISDIPFKGDPLKEYPFREVIYQGVTFKFKEGSFFEMRLANHTITAFDVPHQGRYDGIDDVSIREIKMD